MVELKKIQKYFSVNGIKALDGADFDLKEGEIHALLGENGAGKSTLMHIMAGYLKPGADEGIRGLLVRGGPSSGTGRVSRTGRIFVDGREQRFTSPARALAAGIGMVRQHPHQVPGFLVWENCLLGTKKPGHIWMNRKELRSRVGALNEDLAFNLPLDSLTGSLTVSQSQKAAVLTLLTRNVRYLIFDEPTAVLTPAETESIFEVFKKLRAAGKGIVLISHKLEETLKLADRVTVLRRGRTVISRGTGELNSQALGAYIFGTKTALPESAAAIPGMVPREFPAGPVLELRDLRVNAPGKPLIRGVTLELERGRIMGIAGVRDSGLETLELALTGFLPSLGSIRINGREMNPRTAGMFRKAGGAYLGTRNEGFNLPIRDVLIIHAHRRFQRRGILDRRELDRWAASIMAAAAVPPRSEAPAAAFSGGQFQRMLLIRELMEDSPLLVLSDPGRGLDRRYRQKLPALLKEKTAAGTGALIFSTDVEELLVLSDFITVLRDGVFSGALELRGPESYPGVREKIREAMVGQA
ncbi:MAG: ATP-binding cassette domain-containing protein [Treponema sp.]|jgi:simple sugar transport system ATP-binding protein|nr:ATP-binding cassette domain-containing protein [Treponema sp.]